MTDRIKYYAFYDRTIELKEVLKKLYKISPFIHEKTKLISDYVYCNNCNGWDGYNDKCYCGYVCVDWKCTHNYNNFKIRHMNKIKIYLPYSFDEFNKIFNQQLITDDEFNEYITNNLNYKYTVDFIPH